MVTRVSSTAPPLAEPQLPTPATAPTLNSPFWISTWQACPSQARKQVVEQPAARSRLGFATWATIAFCRSDGCFPPSQFWMPRQPGGRPRAEGSTAPGQSRGGSGRGVERPGGAQHVYGDRGGGRQRAPRGPPHFDRSNPRCRVLVAGCHAQRQLLTYPPGGKEAGITHQFRYRIGSTTESLGS
jgi:hypothetical protein